ncbi:MAG: Gfo/Idh/MocA family protein, partial [Parvibaculaceae bacterium]
MGPGKLGIALIGLGPAAQPHAKSLLDLADRADVVWTVSRSAGRGREFAQAYSFPFTTDLNHVLDDRRVDAVFILTPPHTHLEIATLAFAAGKHVLLEKPIDISIGRGEEILRRAEASGRKLGIVLQHRFRPASKRLKRIVRAGELGDVQGATLSIPWWRPQSYYDQGGRGTFARDGGGVLLTQAIHAIDLFRDLLGVRHVDFTHVRTSRLHDIESVV